MKELVAGLKVTLIAAILASLISIVHGQQSGDKNRGELEIYGKVIEFGLSRGIADVEVAVEFYQAKVESSLTPKSEVARGKTDISGGFGFAVEKEGTYRITVKKDGYVVPGGTFGSLRASAEVSLDKANPKRDLLFQLARPAEISGRVIDEETQKPVTGLPVMAGHYGYAAGRAVLFPGGADAVTGADGRFVLRGLAPADYVVYIGPLMRTAFQLQRSPELKELGATDRMLTEFSKKEIEQIDQDYDSTFWPGGADLNGAIPLPLVSGEQADLGQLKVAKVPKYRVLVSVAGSGCIEGESINLSAWPVSSPGILNATVVGAVRCGGTGLGRGFTPGLYDLEAVAAGGPRGKVPAIASMQFNVSHENTAISVPLMRGVDIDGKALLTEGATKPDLSDVRLHLKPITYGGIRHALIPMDQDGKFRIERVPIREYRLLMAGVPTTHYLKEVRYNGQRLPGVVFAMDPNALAHSLELVFADRPAALMGSVTDDDKPVARAHVVLVPWPRTDPDLYLALLRAGADESGRFKFAGLAPGGYKIFAVPAESKARVERPNALDGLLSTAEETSLGQNQVRNVHLNLTRP